jgi:hypothetical protein
VTRFELVPTSVDFVNETAWPTAAGAGSSGFRNAVAAIQATLAASAARLIRPSIQAH